MDTNFKEKRVGENKRHNFELVLYKTNTEDIVDTVPQNIKDLKKTQHE